MDVAEAARVFVVLNPGSGNATAGQVREALERLWVDLGHGYAVHDLTPGDDLTAVVADAVRQGADLVVAAGGDGTASTVARALVGTPTRLGILPLGTTNVLARELGVPLDLDDACRLLAGPNATRTIDAMRLGDTHAFTQIGVGLDALMIRDTTTANKKRFGFLAYLWTAGYWLSGLQPRKFRIEADDVRMRTRALQVVLVNSGQLGTSGLRWAPDAHVDDGRVEVCIVRARTMLDFVGIAWRLVRHRHRDEPTVGYLAARHRIAIEARPPLPVQADGEVVGETPIDVEVVPRALRVVVPADSPDAPAGDGAGSP